MKIICISSLHNVFPHTICVHSIEICSTWVVQSHQNVVTMNFRMKWWFKNNDIKQKHRKKILTQAATSQLTEETKNQAIAIDKRRERRRRKKTPSMNGNEWRQSNEMYSNREINSPLIWEHQQFNFHRLKCFQFIVNK